MIGGIMIGIGCIIFCINQQLNSPFDGTEEEIQRYETLNKIASLISGIGAILLFIL